jgi:hypothetical protein
MWTQIITPKKKDKGPTMPPDKRKPNSSPPFSLWMKRGNQNKLEEEEANNSFTQAEQTKNDTNTKRANRETY